MLWEHEPQASVCTAFWSSPKLSPGFSNSIETQSACLLFLFARAITTSTVRASSVSPSSYTNTIIIITLSGIVVYFAG